MKTGFIGAGNMGGALIEGLASRKGIPPGNILFSDPDRGRAEYLRESFGATRLPGNPELVRASDTIVIAVKPQAVKGVIEEISGELSEEKLLVSIAAGVETAAIERFAGGKQPVVRAMPNMPAAFGLGMTVICGGKFAREEHLNRADELFSASGDVVFIEEGMMDAATAVSGSGPAYLFCLAEALESAAAREGFTAEVAAKLARSTIYGASAVLEKGGATPAGLKSMVASPGGTTEAALKILEKECARLIVNAVEAARERAAEIRREISTSE